MFEILPNWHPVFVHFTVALLSVAFIVFIISVVARSETVKQHALIVAHWNFWIAVIATFATVIAGWLAYNSVEHDAPSHAAMIVHKNWALATFAILLIVGSVAWWLNHNIKMFGVGLLVVVGFLSITAWHGGELVYRYGLGVMSMPIRVSDDHHHDHGDSHSHGEEHDSQHDSMQVPETSQHSEQHNHGHDSVEESTDSNVHVHPDGEVHTH